MGYFKSSKKQIGKKGEDTAVKFLMKQKFKILDRNYNKKWGEIDIIAEKKRKIHFVEVKTVSCEMVENVSPETYEGQNPFENIHFNKLNRLSRAIRTYILEKKLENREIQIDAIAVYLDIGNKKAKVRTIDNIIID